MEDVRDLKGRTALITGASSGIGRELARVFARGSAAALVLVARDEQRLGQLAEELSERHGTQVVTLAQDLADPAAPERILSAMRDRGIEVDVLVNNAGFNVYGPFSESDGRRELEMLQVHVVALTHLTKLFLPPMIERGWGRVLNMGSTGSFAPCPLDSVYCATKAYLLSFSEAIAEELRGTGVAVTALCPGPVKTPFAERAGIADINLFRGDVLDVAQVAEEGYRAMLEGRGVHVVGRRNRLQVRLARIAPRGMVLSGSRRLMSRG